MKKNTLFTLALVDNLLNIKTTDNAVYVPLRDIDRILLFQLWNQRNNQPVLASGRYRLDIRGGCHYASITISQLNSYLHKLKLGIETKDPTNKHRIIYAPDHTRIFTRPNY